MIDGIGREIDYIRISVTDRCNLRCQYCMPEEGVALADHQDILSYQEIEHLAEIFASMGFQKIKLTGGEPLVRREMEQLVKSLKRIDGIEQVTLTTNGVLLKEKMQALAEADIDGINLSLDSLDAAEYISITRRNEFQKAWDGFLEALKYPEIPLKINCVPMKQSQESLCRMAQLARDYPVHVRFIEMMPIGLGSECPGHSEEEIMEILEANFGVGQPVAEVLGNGPGHYVKFEGFQGKIGFISAVSHKFCSSCNRVRLTAQGYLKACLQYDKGVDLREPLRSGASDSELREIIRQAILEKPEGHAFFQGLQENGEKKIMSQIGG